MKSEIFRSSEYFWKIFKWALSKDWELLKIVVLMFRNSIQKQIEFVKLPGETRISLSYHLTHNWKSSSHLVLPNCWNNIFAAFLLDVEQFVVRIMWWSRTIILLFLWSKGVYLCKINVMWSIYAKMFKHSFYESEVFYFYLNIFKSTNWK